MTRITITLPGEPRGKGRPRARIARSRAGAQFVTIYTDAATRSYESLLRDAAQQAMAGQPLCDGPLKVKVAAFFSVPQSWSRKKREQALRGIVRPTGRPDWDNLVKMLDALNGIVWRDDSQIVQGFVSKSYADKPGLLIEVQGAISIADLATEPLLWGEQARGAA